EEIAAGGVIPGELAAGPQPRGRKAKKAAKSEARSGWDWASISLAILTAGTLTRYVGSKNRPPPPQSRAMGIAATRPHPVTHPRGIKPLDTLARNTLRAISHRETVKVEEPADEKGQAKDTSAKKQTKTLSATQWFLDVISGADQSTAYRVIRIDSPEVRQI